MVERKAQAEPLERFNGIVEDVEQTKTAYKGDDGEVLCDSEQKNQFHILIRPTDKTAIEQVKDSKTKRYHAFITMSETSTDTQIAEGSIMDNYLAEIEACLPETKKMKGITEVLNFLKDKEFEFILKKVGKAYKGMEAKKLYVPRTQIVKK